MITEAEKRIKAAIDRALAMNATAALCDIGDLIDVIQALHSARTPVAAKANRNERETDVDFDRRLRHEDARAEADRMPDVEDT